MKKAFVRMFSGFLLKRLHWAIEQGSAVGVKLVDGKPSADGEFDWAGEKHIPSGMNHAFILVVDSLAQEVERRAVLWLHEQGWISDAASKKALMLIQYAIDLDANVEAIEEHVDKLVGEMKGAK